MLTCVRMFSCSQINVFYYDSESHAESEPMAYKCLDKSSQGPVFGRLTVQNCFPPPVFRKGHLPLGVAVGDWWAVTSVLGAALPIADECPSVSTLSLTLDSDR